MGRRRQSFTAIVRLLTYGLLAAAASALTSIEVLPVTAQQGAIAAFLGESGDTWVLESSGEPRYLLALPTENHEGLAVDPSGRTVVTVRPQEALREIVLIDIANGAVTGVPTTRARNCSYPASHPDGVHILAICTRILSSTRVTVTLDMFHREQGFVRTILSRTLTEGTLDLDIPFGPAGTRIVVAPDGALAVLNQQLGDGGNRVWRVDLGSGDAQPLVLAGGEPFGSRVTAFLADGRMLGETCTDCVGAGPGPSNPQTQIAVFSQAGRLDAVLHSVADVAFASALSPDGGTLLYSTSAPPAFEAALWALNRATGEVRRVADGVWATYPQPSTTSTAPSVAPTAPSLSAAPADAHCLAGQNTQFVFGFADLKAHVGMAMGEPVTCEFADPNGTGDVHQRTTTGLAFWRKATNVSSFTDGSNHWALVPTGVVTWIGPDIDPPPSATSHAGSAGYSASAIWIVDPTRDDLLPQGCGDSWFALAPYEHPTDVSCVVEAMRADGAEAEALRFFEETHQFLDEFRESGRVDLGRAGAPWLNMGRGELVFLNGMQPALLLSELYDDQLRDWRVAPGYPELTRQHPSIGPWFEYEQVDASENLPSGGQRLVVSFRMHECRACPNIAWMPVAFSFDPAGALVEIEILHPRPT